MNNLKVGDIVRSTGNPDFIYGITKIKQDGFVNGVVLENISNSYSIALLGVFNDCRPEILYKVKTTSKRKLKFLEKLDRELLKKNIDNLDYIETKNALTDGSKKLK